MPSDTAIAAEFRAGETLEWVRIEGDVRTRRQVRFLERYGDDEAIVGFGQSSDGQLARYAAPLRELSRPKPPDGLWFLPNGRWEPPTPPVPPTPEQLSANLTQRREALRIAHARERQAQDVVRAAKELSDRAERACIAARAELAGASAADQQAADEFEAALRAGKAPQPVRNGRDRNEIEHKVSRAETAFDRFNQELATSNSRLGEALDAVRRAAADVMAALLERECESLRALEAEAARHRAELVAVASWWPDATKALQLGAAAAALLAAPIDYSETPLVRMTSNETRIGPWKAVYDRLVQGDAEADFKLEG